MKRHQRIRWLCLTGALIAAVSWTCIYWIRTDPVIRSKLSIRVSRWLEESVSAGNKVRNRMPISAGDQVAANEPAVPGRQQFDALNPDDPERLESFRSLAGSIQMPAEDLLSMANTFSGGAKLSALVSLAESCVRENPELYFQMLDGMSPGSARDQVISRGADSLDLENLNRLIDRISSESNPNEIESLAAALRFREAPNSSPSNELLELAARQRRPELAGALAFAAGHQTVTNTGTQAHDHFSLEIRQGFQEGRLKRMLEDHDPAFGANLASADLASAARKELIQEWAEAQSWSLDAKHALQQGRVLAEPDFETYCSAIARTLVRMSPKEAAAEISGLPSGKPRNLMIAELAKHFEKTGDAAETERWKKEMSGKSSK